MQNDVKKAAGYRMVVSGFFMVCKTCGKLGMTKEVLKIIFKF